MAKNCVSFTPYKVLNDIFAALFKAHKVEKETVKVCVWGGGSFYSSLVNHP